MDPTRPAFVRAPLDRAEAIRKDPARLSALEGAAHARVAPFWRGRPFVIRRGGAAEPAYLDGRGLGELSPELTVFLGLDGDTPVFAAALAGDRTPGPEFPLHGLGEFSELRELAAVLHADDAAILGTARSLLAWHADHGFCARCGGRSNVVEGGWKRSCPHCGAEHFPRVNPVVIMAITDGERLLLGRQASWPAGVFSCLAGFVEPGETFEAAAQREALEEASVRIDSVRYVMDQPWPFPSSLMVGLMAHTRDREARADMVEVEAVRWFDRGEVAALMADAHPDVRTPPVFTIAHHLIRGWADAQDREGPHADAAPEAAFSADAPRDSAV